MIDKIKKKIADEYHIDHNDLDLIFSFNDGSNCKAVFIRYDNIIGSTHLYDATYKIYQKQLYIERYERIQEAFIRMED